MACAIRCRALTVLTTSFTTAAKWPCACISGLRSMSDALRRLLLRSTATATRVSLYSLSSWEYNSALQSNRTVAAQTGSQRRFYRLRVKSKQTLREYKICRGKPTHALADKTACSREGWQQRSSACSCSHSAVEQEESSLIMNAIFHRGLTWLAQNGKTSCAPACAEAPSECARVIQSCCRQ